MNGPQSMKLSDFGIPGVFLYSATMGLTFVVKCLDNCQMNCHEMWYTHSG